MSNTEQERSQTGRNSHNKESESTQKSAKRKRALNTFVQVSTLAWIIIASIAVGVFAGQWVDSKLGTHPVFIIILSVLGVVSAIRFVINFSRRL